MSRPPLLPAPLCMDGTRTPPKRRRVERGGQRESIKPFLECCALVFIFIGLLPSSDVSAIRLSHKRRQRHFLLSSNRQCCGAIGIVSGQRLRLWFLSFFGFLLHMVYFTKNYRKRKSVKNVEAHAFKRKTIWEVNGWFCVTRLSLACYRTLKTTRIESAYSSVLS